jgi:hypothetical protein
MASLRFTRPLILVALSQKTAPRTSSTTKTGCAGEGMPHCGWIVERLALAVGSEITVDRRDPDLLRGLPEQEAVRGVPGARRSRGSLRGKPALSEAPLTFHAGVKLSILPDGVVRSTVPPTLPFQPRTVPPRQSSHPSGDSRRGVSVTGVAFTPRGAVAAGSFPWFRPSPRRSAFELPIPAAFSGWAGAGDSRRCSWLYVLPDGLAVANLGPRSLAPPPGPKLTRS